ncbi:hypothetical protein LTS18_014058, partial [Coniosporium uncinatum]
MIKQFLENDEPDKSIGASLRPQDPLAKRHNSRKVSTDLVVLKVTVPKRTGRKRKRGSSAPFTGPVQSNDDGNSRPWQELASNNPRILLQTLRDRPEGYSIRPVGH